MVGLVISGAMLSVGHHYYYRSFGGARVASREQQTWRSGLELALPF
jgi:hypothetical protein